MVDADAPIDTVSLALIMGAAFVDGINPCMAFNNHPGSTSRYDYVREHNEAVNRIDFIETRPEVTADHEEGRVVEIPHHDGTLLRLRKLHAEYDPTDRIGAMNYVQQHQARG